MARAAQKVNLTIDFEAGYLYNEKKKPEDTDMYRLDTLPAELAAGAKEICGELGIALGEGGTPVYAREGDMAIEAGESVVIYYRTKPQFFRMLAMLTGEVSGRYEESPRQTMLCYMADQSRNAVMTPGAARKMIRYLAALGYDSMMLYTEDTYEVPERPYFGYLRGKWTQAEIRELDAYAAQFGIELIPCMQTLAHINQILRWNCFKPMIDCNDILLVDDERTYAFIDDMFKACADSFTSRRINIGMDEAHMLGLGKYLDKHGYHERTELMLRHLERVCGIAEKYGFHPMMWSDMFFRIAFGTYYVSEGEISEEVINKVPENLTLIYWDYYTPQADKFAHMVKCHTAFHNPIAFAGGAHKWGNLVADNMVTYELEPMHIEECFKQGLTQIIATGWGDDGAEAAQFSILPGLIIYAETCYRGGKPDREWLDARVEALMGMPMRAFELTDMLDRPCGANMLTNERRTYFIKAMLYSDVLQGIYNRHIDRDAFEKHYAELAKELEQYVGRGKFGYLMGVPLELARIATIKSTLSIDLRAAYRAGDKAKLKALADKTAELAEEIEKLLCAMELQWRTENRAAGLEVQQLRMGGAARRAKGAADAVNAYLDGTLEKIDELEEDALYLDCRPDDAEPDYKSLPGKGAGYPNFNEATTVARMV